MPRLTRPLLVMALNIQSVGAALILHDSPQRVPPLTPLVKKSQTVTAGCARFYRLSAKPKAISVQP